MSVVSSVIVVSTGSRLGSSRLSVRGVSSSLGFTGMSFFKGCFGHCMKVDPLRCQGGKWDAGGRAVVGCGEFSFGVPRGARLHLGRGTGTFRLGHAYILNGARLHFLTS